MTYPLPGGGSNLFRYSAVLTKLLNMRGGEPLESVAPELQGTLPLDSDRLWIARYRQELSWASIQAPTGDATHRGIVYIQNPVNSGIVSLVEGMIITNENGTNEQFQWEHNAATTAATAGRMFNRDNRVRGLPATIGTNSGTNAAPGASILMGKVALLAGTSIFIPVEYVLGEQNELVISSTNNTKICSVSVFGRERPMEPGEKAPL